MHSVQKAVHTCKINKINAAINKC